MIICVDFDGTLVYDYPNDCTVNEKVLNWCLQQKRKGHKLILWTCREGKWLEEAIDLMAERGLYFDKVNENIYPYQNNQHQCGKRKVIADVYLDDRAMLISQI